MTQPNHPISGRILIVGGGVAGLEALLALRTLASDRVSLTLVSPQDWFIDRPMTVVEPFGLGSAARHSLPDIAADAGAGFVHATVAEVDAAGHRVICTDQSQLAYDTLILALGAQARAPFAYATTFGLEGSAQAIRTMLGALRRGEAQSVAFVAPTVTGWLLPLYELALMTAHELARCGVDGVDLRILSSEDRPLALFGGTVSQSVGRLIDAAGIEFVRASFAQLDDGGLLYGAVGHPTPDYVVTLPLLSG